MTQEDEDIAARHSMDAEADDEISTMDPRARQLMQLLMRSQDIDDVDPDASDDKCVVGGAGSRTGNSDDDDAPVIADAEIDLMVRREPESPPSSLPAPVREFCRDHGIDPAILPDPSAPATDPGVTFESILCGDVKPTGVMEIQLVSQTTKVDVDAGQTHRILGLGALALCGRTNGHAQPGSFSGSLATRLNVEDVAGRSVTLLVSDDALANLPPEEFAAEVIRRYPAGTAVVIKGLDLVVLPTSFILIVNLAEEGAAIYRLGEAALPPVKLAQIDRQCKLLLTAGLPSRMVSQSIEAPKAAVDEVAATLHPLLTRLAVAHLRLGADGIALAYATAALVLVHTMGPPTAVCVAAHVLNGMDLKTAVCAAVYLGDFPNGHELEPLEAVGQAGLKALAEVDSGRNISIRDRLTETIKAGVAEIAEGLARTEKQWLEHALEPKALQDITAAVSQAVRSSGPRACESLMAEAQRLYDAGAPSGEAMTNREKVEAAIRLWRAALWMMLHPEGSADSTGYAAWSIVNTRYKSWHELPTADADPGALKYMDLAGLAMMQAEHVNTFALRTQVYRARCQVQDWRAVLDDALAASLATLGLPS